MSLNVDIITHTIKLVIRVKSLVSNN